MSLRSITPCDEPGLDGRHHCPYDSDGWPDCEYYCGDEEPQDNPETEEDNNNDVE